MKAFVTALLMFVSSFLTVTAQAAQLYAGKADAKVKMLVYGDYECGFTVRMMKNVEPLMAEFGDDLAISFAQFPLDFHPNAERAAQGGVCAGDQGKLAEYSNIVFNKSRDLRPEIYAEAAKNAGVPDVAAFERCMDSADTKTRIAGDQFAGKAAGVSGTPNTFINGQLVQGAYPLDDFRSIIREKLAIVNSKK